MNNRIIVYQTLFPWSLDTFARRRGLAFGLNITSPSQLPPGEHHYSILAGDCPLEFSPNAHKEIFWNRFFEYQTVPVPEWGYGFLTLDEFAENILKFLNTHEHDKHILMNLPLLSDELSTPSVEDSSVLKGNVAYLRLPLPREQFSTLENFINQSQDISKQNPH